MYRYSAIDKVMVSERVEQFRSQMDRYLKGELSDREFLPLRLQNGLYVQRHAPMLRVAIPYGELSPVQMRMLARLAREFDKGYGHFTTRQNIQYNWPALEAVPDMLALLASVEMHAIQTSGNCIRNVTSDHYAGIIANEVEDPRPWCELIRQWSTFHPEFAFLPRKFKIAVTGAVDSDRAAVEVHDIGLKLVRNDQDKLAVNVYVGGGLGRTPVSGALIRQELPPEDLFSYLDAILRVYNRYGRRDNMYKARIKILVKAMGAEAFATKVDAEWEQLNRNALRLSEDSINEVKSHFQEPEFEPLNNLDLTTEIKQHPGFGAWLSRNTHPHKQPGYTIVDVSLKQTGIAPGDATDTQMDHIADLAEQFSLGELRVTHHQNLVFPHVKQTELVALWHALKDVGFATANIGCITDIICCPGGDFCNLANAKSIPIAQAIQEKFEDMDYVYDLGDIDLNISGCMNACGHHHVGHIGILGVDKKGAEFYQVSVGGNSGAHNSAPSIGKILGPSFGAEDIPAVIEKLMNVYVQTRIDSGETFLETVKRVGVAPFKEAAYA